MYIAERSPRDQVTTSTPLAPDERLTALLDQQTEVRVRGLVSLCRQLSRQYQETPETCLERSWWRLFNQAGICLREALDQARAEGYPGMSDQEAEQAYFLLIHVAYFFEPGGVAEEMWPLLPAELGEQQGPPATSEALGLSFGTPLQVGAEIRAWQQVRWWQRLGQLLVRNPTRKKNVTARYALTAHAPPPQVEETPVSGA